MLDRRRACHAGSRAHVDQCAAEIGGIERGGIHIKGKSAIHVARHFLRRERNYAGQRIWARGFFVDTVGRDTETIRKYIAEQEMEDRRLDQLEMPEITRE
jgi:putative transposase